MSKLSRIRTAAVCTLCGAGGLGTSVCGVRLLPGIDINQRVIDGQREPINKFLSSAEALHNAGSGRDGYDKPSKQRPTEHPKQLFVRKSHGLVQLTGFADQSLVRKAL